MKKVTLEFNQLPERMKEKAIEAYINSQNKSAQDIWHWNMNFCDRLEPLQSVLDERLSKKEQETFKGDMLVNSRDGKFNAYADGKFNAYEDGYGNCWIEAAQAIKIADDWMLLKVLGMSQETIKAIKDSKWIEGINIWFADRNSDNTYMEVCLTTKELDIIISSAGVDYAYRIDDAQYEAQGDDWDTVIESEIKNSDSEDWDTWYLKFLKSKKLANIVHSVYSVCEAWDEHISKCAKRILEGYEYHFTEEYAKEALADQVFTIKGAIFNEYGKCLGEIEDEDE